MRSFSGIEIYRVTSFVAVDGRLAAATAAV